ncbi:TolB family protein [Sunxiuqinia sp. sy24]|uniref:TolB family protein n=1 Tax=Sunxiuqinia sp. sy24 TaxID=3461495 RepID=UPI0040463E8D
MKLTLILLFKLILTSIFPQNSIGIFSYHQDIGTPKRAGSALFDSQEQEYTLTGSGYNIWFDRDEFHYLYNKLDGDFILTANFAFEGEGIDPHRKVGWMVRASSAENDVHCSAVLHGDGLTAMQWRQLKGSLMRKQQDELFAPKAHYQILQLERKGKTMIFRAAHPGEPLQLIGSQTLESLPEKVLAGLFINAHNPEVVEKAKIWNVRIDQPVANNYTPEKEGWLACRLETLHVFTGKRKVIYQSNERFEAPNWMPDGQKLLFNSKGLLYTIPIEGGAPKQLDTGFAKRNNNDHGISFDGKLLAISHHREGLPGGGSSIYVLPLEGGTPQLITEKTPSYWHGWAPNNKEVVYVAQRSGSSVYNIYKNSIKGGQEVALTANKPGEHVDGCEYSPDGKYIYYNGSQSGTMQIWRMQPDGSGKEQITFDEYNDWFPHISPDGQWIAFISFPPDIEFNSHPSYKRVMLRLMPTAGGAPKVIAYLYGGQGTINVPSWSPNSKQISFVSNSGKD